LIDFWKKKQISRTRLQLVAATAMLVSSKFEEIYVPEIKDFVVISDNAFTKDDVINMERLLLNNVGWNISIPTSLHFYRRFSRASKADTKSHTLGRYLIELSLSDYNFLQYLPSCIAASGTYLARRMLKREPSWDVTAIHYTKYREADLLPCVRDLNKVLTIEITQPSTRWKAVTLQYSSPQSFGVAQIPPLNPSQLD